LQRRGGTCRLPLSMAHRLTYDVEARWVANWRSLASRIIDGFAKKMADQFFNNSREHLKPAERYLPEPLKGAEGTCREKAAGSVAAKADGCGLFTSAVISLVFRQQHGRQCLTS